MVASLPRCSGDDTVRPRTGDLFAAAGRCHHEAGVTGRRPCRTTIPSATTTAHTFLLVVFVVLELCRSRTPGRSGARQRKSGERDGCQEDQHGRHNRCSVSGRGERPSSRSRVRRSCAVVVDRHGGGSLRSRFQRRLFRAAQVRVQGRTRSLREPSPRSAQRPYRRRGTDVSPIGLS